MGKKFQIALYVCLVSIEYLATTTQEIKPLEHTWDKANHFIAFMTLFVLLSLAYKHLSLVRRVVLLLLFGLQIEIVQYFIPGRDFSLLDVVADSVGIAIGIALYYGYEKVIKASS
ncbi:hypothetical protein MNB_SM-5-438 [hydrothermal vent metagenome]|uniref:VanZ-like domain-containing protein n=1 Tax=hydrothermal vent metagenome TaxID=652676 RepID=A0A1W1C4R1_9ZZZZ